MHNEFIRTLLSGAMFSYDMNHLRANNILTQKSKRLANMFLEEFKKTDGILDKMFDEKEDYAKQLSEIMEQYINRLVINVWDMENMCILYDVYAKHPQETQDFVNNMLKKDGE